MRNPFLQRLLITLVVSIMSTESSFAVELLETPGQKSEYELRTDAELQCQNKQIDDLLKTCQNLIQLVESRNSAEQTCETEDFIAELLIRADQLEESVHHAKRSWELSQSRFGKDNWQTMTRKWHAESFQLLARQSQQTRQEYLKQCKQLTNALANGKWKRALEVLNTLEKKETDLFGEDHFYTLLSAYHRASCLLELGEHKAAELSAQNFIKRFLAFSNLPHPELANGYIILGRVLYARGNRSDAMRQWDLAITVSEKCQNKQPEAEALYWRGSALKDSQEWEHAIKNLSKAASLFTESNDHGSAGYSHTQLAFILAEQKNPAKAAERFRLAASEHHAANTPLEPFTCLLRSAELYARARRYEDTVKAISESSKHAAAAARTMSEDDLLTELESVISELLPVLESATVIDKGLEAWSSLTGEIGSEQVVAGARADTLLSSKLSASKNVNIFNAQVKWRTDIVRRWRDRSRIDAFLIQKDHARLLDQGRQSQLSTIEKCSEAYEDALRLGKVGTGVDFQPLRAVLTVEASAVAEELDIGSGLRILEQNNDFLRKHLKGKSLWQMYRLRSVWLIKANRQEEGITDLFAAVDALEAAEDATDVEIRNSLAALVLAATEANGQSPIDEAEERARRRLLLHLTKMKDRASFYSELLSLRRRLALGGKKEKAALVLEQMLTAARGLDVDSATPAELTAAVSVLGTAAGELESTGLLVPSRITSDVALKLCKRLPMPSASGMKLGLLGHQLALAQTGGQTDRVLVLAESIKSLRPSYAKQLSLWSEDLPKFEFGSKTRYNALYVTSLCQSAKYFLVQPVASDIKEAIKEARELDSVIARIASLMVKAEGTDSEFARQAQLSRVFLWDTIQTRCIDGSELLTEAQRKYVADMRQAAFVEYAPDESEVELQKLYAQMIQVAFRFQNLSDEERADEKVLKEIAKEFSSIAKKFRSQQIIYQRDVAVQILLGCCFADFANGNFGPVIKTCNEATDMLEQFVIRTGGPPQEIIARSQELRSGLDPCTFGLMASVLNDDPKSAFEFAARGRSLGSRIAWQRTQDLSNALSNESRPAWLPADGRLTLEEQYSAFTSAGSERQGRSSKVLADQIASVLKPDERYILISTLHGTLAGKDHDLSDDVGLFFLRPKTHSRPGIQFFERGTDSAVANESVPTEGVYVINVVTDSVAFHLGIRPGDIIKKVSGIAVTPDNFLSELRKTSSKQNIKFGVYRNGEVIELLRLKPAKLLGVLFSKSSPREAERQSREINSPKLAEARTFQVASLSNHGWSTRSSRSAKLIENDDAPLLSAKGESWRLFRSLFPAEVWEELKSVRKVYVSVPGQLAGLPLETLVVQPPSGNSSEKETVRWIDVGPQVVYLPFASLIPVNQDADVQPAKLAYLGIGDVDFTTVENVELPRLPNSRREVESISHVFKNESVKVLLGSDASEESLFHIAPEARVISIATHGLYKDGLDTLETSVVLGATTMRGNSEFPEERRNGKLTLRDLLTDWRGRLQATELTILSACQTGGGLVTQEDGTVGLPFGFLTAGSDAVIASQWPVDDVRTADLFSQMFTNQEDDMLSAFTKARRKLRVKHPDPHFWAPFIYISSH